MGPLPTRLADVPPPPWHLLLGEVRAVLELASFPGPLDGLPRGDGHPILVLPGFGAGDAWSAPLRGALARLGYAPEGWGLGWNLGMTRAKRERLDAWVASQSRPASLLGWSLGGIFARELARRHPTRVRGVYTLGSPITGTPHANRLLRVSHLFGPAESEASFLRRVPPPPVPCVAFVAERDGIVAGACAREHPAPNTETVVVPGTHTGLLFNRAVLRALAERLAR